MSTLKKCTTTTTKMVFNKNVKFLHSSPKKSTSETCRSWLTSVAEVSQGEPSVCPINSFVYAAGRRTHTQGSRTIG